MAEPKRDLGASLSGFLSVLADGLEQLAAHHWAHGFAPGLTDDVHELADASRKLAEEVRRSGGCPTEFGAEITEAVASFFARYQALGARLGAHLRSWPSAAMPTGIALD